MSQCSGSMSAYMNGPWRCGHGTCMGRLDECRAKARNKAEREWLEKAQAEFDAQEGRWDPYRLMILRLVGEAEPEVSIEEARKELRWP